MNEIKGRVRIIIGIVLIITFFSIFFIRLNDYGINWDEPLHFARGQAYLNYFISGRDDFSNLPLKKPSFRKSIYIISDWDAKYWKDNDSGHPPLNGILSAITNKIFFEWLGIFPDIAAYHLFEIALGALLLFVVYVFDSENYGIFAGVIASLTTFLYPLFLAEVNFNIKDPPETAFFTLTIFAFYKGITKLNVQWILLSSISFGIAFGTKFNVLFLPCIIVPWLLIYIYANKKELLGKKISTYKGVLITLILYPFIAFGIFFATWPYLWHNFLPRFFSIITYYKDIGTKINYQPQNFLFLGWNTFPFQWILYTTPVITLFFCFIGIAVTVINMKKEKKKTALLFLLWLIVPILRVSIPGSSIYGGDRQIMEFIPAMALLAGIGAKQIKLIVSVIGTQFVNHTAAITFSIVLIFTFFIPLTVKLVQIHPNENVYFNWLIGGLYGARMKNFPSWGNSYGNTYFQGIQWLNKHAEKKANVALINGTGLNIPITELRHDLIMNNNSWSGTYRHGEYIMDMYYGGFPESYCSQYLHTYLTNVHEIKVDGVPIFIIWKNDSAHTKKGFLHEDTDVTVTHISKENNWITMTLDKKIYLTKLDELYTNKDCTQLKNGYVVLSPDGNVWHQQLEDIPTLQVTMDIEPKNKRLVYLFAAKPAQYIRIYADSKNSCVLYPEKITLSKLTDILP